MKTLFFMIIFMTKAFAGIDNCLKDAESHGNYTHAITPSIECVDLIKNLNERVEDKLEGSHAYGTGHMLYVDLFEAGNLISRKLLAGDQTELTNIRKVKIQREKSKLLLLQDDSLNTYELTFIGNVTPIRKVQASFISGAYSMKLLNEEDMIVFFGTKKVTVINSQADSRGRGEKIKILYEVSGLTSPSDFVFDRARNQFYILDSNRILVFSAAVTSPSAPSKIIQVNESHSITLNNGHLILIKSTGEELEVPLIN